MTDEITKASMVAILARWQVAYFCQEAQKAIREEADKKIAEFSKTITECKMSAKSLGFDRSDEDAWKTAIGEFLAPAQELYTKAKPPGLPDWDWLIKKPPPQQDPEITEANNRALPPPPWLAVPAPPPPPPPERPSIRQIVLDRLETAAGSGAKAAEIRQYIETAYSEEIHEKTVGMTLYRLLKDGLARRQGHMWFLVPQTTAETKNPGGETPGLSELFS